MIANKFPNLDKAIKFIRTHWVYLLTAFTILNLAIYLNQRQKYQDLNNISSTSTIRDLDIIEKTEISFYIIRSGDTLWDLAEKNYSSGFEYKKIIKNNPGKTFKFEDGKEGLIYPGTEIIL
jgi:nucleoid-associated protein YgaU